jgi:hypothetical protein
MVRFTYVGVGIAMSGALLVAPIAAGQQQETEALPPMAYVTAVTENAASCVDTSGDVRRLDTRSYRFSDENNGVHLGESVRTSMDGSAMVTLFDHGMVVHLEHSSELAFLPAPQADDLVSFVLMLRRGRAYVLRRGDVDDWLLVACESQGVAGYTLSRGASLVVRAEVPGAAFTVSHGRLAFFEGDVPEALPADGAAAWAGLGVAVDAGRSITTSEPDRAIEDALPVATATSRLNREMYKFGVESSARWVAEAEQGDFTPVRGAARGEPGLISQVRQEAFVFDQPRTSVIPAPATQAEILTRATRISPAEASLQSRIPTAVVAASRFLNARFIGSSGGLRVNREIRRNIVFGK